MKRKTIAYILALTMLTTGIAALTAGCDSSENAENTTTASTTDAENTTASDSASAEKTTTPETTGQNGTASQNTTDKSGESTTLTTEQTKQTENSTQVTTAKGTDGTTASTTSKTTVTTKKTTAQTTVTTKQTYDIADDVRSRYNDFGIDADARIAYFKKIARGVNIPIIHISTNNNELILSREEYTKCLVDVFNCGEEYTIDAASAGIKVRGNSSAYYGDVNQIKRNAVPYRIKFDTKSNMLGLHDGDKAKDWVLIKSNWNLVTDFTALNLADAVFNGEYYYSDCTFVYVYVNQKFQDIYLLCEQTEINKKRINITEAKDNYAGTDIGYLLEIDHYASDEPFHFNMNYADRATVTDLEGTSRAFVETGYTLHADTCSDAQLSFITKYTNNVFKIIYEATQNNNYLMFDNNYNLVSATGTYSNAKDTISAVMDLNSVVDMYILHELVHSYDCGIGSFYMTVDFSASSIYPRLTFIAPWDFNWSYNDASTNKYYAAAFNADSFVRQYEDRTNPWFVTLMTQDWFVNMVKAKWTDAYDSGRINSAIAFVQKTLDDNESDFSIRNDWAVGSAQQVIDWVKERIGWLNRVW